MSDDLSPLDRDGALAEAIAADWRPPPAARSCARWRRPGLIAPAAALATAGVAEAAGEPQGDIAILNYALTLEYLQASVLHRGRADQRRHRRGRQARPDRRRPRARPRARAAQGCSADGRSPGRSSTSTERPSPRSAFVRTAVAFEDLGVAAYKGQAPRITSPTYLDLRALDPRRRGPARGLDPAHRRRACRPSRRSTSPPPPPTCLRSSTRPTSSWARPRPTGCRDSRDDMTRGSRTWAAAAIAAGCVVGAVATTRAASRRRARPAAAGPAAAPPAPIALVRRAARARGLRPARRARAERRTHAAAPAHGRRPRSPPRSCSRRWPRSPSPRRGPRRRSTVPARHARAAGSARLPRSGRTRPCRLRRCHPARPGAGRRCCGPSPPAARPGGKVARGCGCARPSTPSTSCSSPRPPCTAAGCGCGCACPCSPTAPRGGSLRSALSGYTFVDTHLVVSLRHRRLTLYRARQGRSSGHRSASAPRHTPTPRGQFYIRDRLPGTRARSTARSRSARAPARPC